MNTTELVDAVRKAAQLSPNDPTYTAAQILTEATQALWDKFSEPVQQIRSGYWLHVAEVPTVATNDDYRIPANTVVQGLEKLELSVDGLRYYELNILTQPQASPFTGQAEGVPTHFTLESDHVRLWPTPAGVYTLRFTFYLRPPTLMTYEDECRVVVATPSGIMVTSDPAALAIPITTSTGIYVQNQDGSQEVPCFNGVVSSITGVGPYLIGLSSYSGFGRIRAGDYVRPAGYGVFPMLPQELHRPLADYVGAMILLSKGDKEKAATLSQKAESGIERFVNMANSRVKTRPFVWRNTNSYLRRNFGWR